MTACIRLRSGREHRQQDIPRGSFREAHRGMSRRKPVPAGSFRLPPSGVPRHPDRRSDRLLREAFLRKPGDSPSRSVPPFLRGVRGRFSRKAAAAEAQNAVEGGENAPRIVPGVSDDRFTAQYAPRAWRGVFGRDGVFGPGGGFGTPRGDPAGVSGGGGSSSGGAETASEGFRAFSDGGFRGGFGGNRAKTPLESLRAFWTARFTGDAPRRAWRAVFRRIPFRWRRRLRGATALRRLRGLMAGDRRGIPAGLRGARSGAVPRGRPGGVFLGGFLVARCRFLWGFRGVGRGGLQGVGVGFLSL